MKKCPYCGHGNDEQAKVCGHCYAGLPAGKQEKEPVKAQSKGEKKHGT